MIFCSDRAQSQFRGKASEFLFFTLIGGALGVFIGGSAGLLRGIPLKRALPQTVFRSAAFFGTTSAVQSALELGRDEKDALNPLLSGGWTGFIFGHGLSNHKEAKAKDSNHLHFLARNFGYGVVLGLNGALINWAVQSISFAADSPNYWLDRVQSSVQAFNPVFTGEDFTELAGKITVLKAEINKLKEEK